MMNKWMVIAMVFSLALALAACGSKQNSDVVPTASTELSQEGILLVGTLKLESTDLAVTSDQAEKLIPLWDTLSSLESGGTAAGQEVKAVINQIEGVMSAEQMSSITAMNLTRQDLAAAMLNTGATTKISTAGSSTSSNAVQFPTDGGAPTGGNPPADMGGAMPSGAGAQDSGQVQMLQGDAAQSDAVNSAASDIQVSPALINALVEVLKAKMA
jgi:hypothetical protein